MLNVFSGVGVLSSDPRICKTTMNKEFARFTVEIERSPNQDGKKGYDRINCSAWNKALEKVKYIESGDLIAFSGSVRTYAHKDGETWVNEWTVDVNNVDILKRSFETDQMDRGPAAPDVQLPFDICGGQY